MSFIKNFLFSALLAALPVGPPVHAAEFEVLDRFSVDGYTVLRGSADIPGGSFTVGGSAFTVKNGSVGVGTTAPAYKAVVQGAANTKANLTSFDATGAADAIFAVQDSAVTTKRMLLGLVSDGSGAGIIQVSNVGTARGDLLLEPNGGNVGIGTASPGSKLDVAGDMRLQYFDFLTSEGGGPSHYLTLAPASATSVNDGITLALKPAGGAYGYFNITDQGAAKVHFGLGDMTAPSYINTPGNFYFNGGGNLGIGTTGVNQKLSVNGGIGFSNQNDADKKLYSPSDGTLQWMTNNTAAAHAFEISHQGTTVYTHLDTTGNSYIAANGGGNVGIGITNPVTTFDVGGTAAIKIPVGTTEQRPVSPVAGMMRFNSTANKVEFYNGASWFAIGAVTATGGNTITDAGGYRIHVFTGNGTFTVTNGGNVEYLVVAGGGAGGNGTATGHESGGGGAGGFLTGIMGILPGSYPVTVGSGGAARTSTSCGENGGTSIFNSINALGGGGGASSPSGGNSGGSGGGGSHNQTAGGAGTSGQGYAGAAPGQASRGGGGGGASGPGGLGAGGDGLSSSISGSPVTYAGGGGGALYANVAGGAGGGGAGIASGYGYGTAGTANTGGGGGGGTQAATNTGGGAGGSGIVIIRYSN